MPWLREAVRPDRGDRVTTPVPPQAIEVAVRAFMHAMGCTDDDCQCDTGHDEHAIDPDDGTFRAVLEAAAPVLHDHWAPDAATRKLFRRYERERNRADALGAKLDTSAARIAELKALAAEMLGGGWLDDAGPNTLTRWRKTLAGTS
jgi:hypothetical protein